MFAVVLLCLLRSAGVDWSYVVSNSMSPSIHVGDCVVINKAAYSLRLPFSSWQPTPWSQPQRGDIVVLHAPDDGERLVKRVIGLPGDRIEIRDNTLVINGELMTIDSLPNGNSAGYGEYRVASERLGERTHDVVLCADRPALRSLAPLVVPGGQYFVLGDNRDESVDSRVFGMVAADQIIGRVIGVTFAFDPTKHFAPIWARCFRRVT
jgi:signal peptidase I